jgi:hypothetical protein
MVMINFFKKASSVCFLIFLSIGLSYGGMMQGGQPSKEYQIKAVFLFNFTRFVEWPSSAFSEPSTPFIIGILKSDPFGAFLEETIRNENSKGHPLVIKRFRKAEEIDSCHMLFINTANKNELKLAFEKAKGLSILTVGDATGFSEQGGMIQFVTQGNKTRVRINLGAVKDAGLTISSKLLGLAEIVDSRTN